MSIKIHHGPNGSYKSAGAIWDDLIPAFAAGRTIITNVRGVTAERLVAALGLDPKTVGEVVHVTMEGEQGIAGRDRLAKVFHWAPRGAFIFLDEVHEIWKPTWREKDIRLLDWPEGPESADRADRPRDLQHACSMHRHWNWDIVVTTPDIDWVRDELRAGADGAYRHMNAAVIGLRGRYAEIQHHPKNSGMALSHVINKAVRRVNKDVFRCYDSTATGVALDTISGKSLLRNPRVLVLVGALIAVGVFVATRPVPRVLGGGGEAGVAVESPGPVVGGKVVRKGDPGAGRGDDRRGGGFKVADVAVEVNDPFEGGELTLGGMVGNHAKAVYLIVFSHAERGRVVLTSKDLERAGWVVRPLGDCMARMVRGRDVRTVLCAGVGEWSRARAVALPDQGSAVGSSSVVGGLAGTGGAQMAWR